MSIEGEVYGEGSDGEEVFIDDEDIINEIPLDEEGRCYLYKCPPSFLIFLLCAYCWPCPDLPDQDDDDEQEEDVMGMWPSVTNQLAWLA